MASPTNTPNNSRAVDRVFSPTSSPSTARRFDERDRASIISTSTKGWAPLNTKRSSILASSPAVSPGRVSGLSASTTGQGPRRTSSSFKHVRHNNLVSNSIFKSPSTSTGSPSATQSSPAAKIGLGIGLSSNRKTSGGTSSSGRRKVSAGSSSGGRKVSGSTKNVVNAGSTPRKASLTEDLRTSNGVTPSSSGSPSSSASRKTGTPRQATGLTNLASSGYVSRSPFLQHTSSFEGSTTPSSSTERNYASSSPGKNSPAKYSERMANENGSSAKKLAIPSESISTKQPEQVYLASLISHVTATGSNSSQRSYFPTTESTSQEMDIDAHPQALSSTTSLSPGKSSLTSRRLRGPRLSDPSSTAQIYGSSTYSSSSISRRAVGLGGGPQLPKTVTFRDVADVKEFETGSSDGGEWEDDDVEDEGDYEEGESWDEVLLGPSGSAQQQQQRQQEQEARDREAFTENTPSPEMDLSGLRRYGSLNSRPSPAKSRLNSEMGPIYAEQEREEDEGYAGYIAGLGHQQHGIMEEDESTTANFIDSLYEDGYLSPAQSQSESSLAALATSVAMSDSVRSNSIDEGEVPDGHRSQEKTQLERYEEPLERDECGIPLGRTHHADRAVAAHEVQRQHHEGLSLQQPALPRMAPGDGQQLGETMLRSGDVTVPAIKGANGHARQEDPISAHQDGQFVDPFVTIQTATRVNYNENHTVAGSAVGPDVTRAQQREEGGVPLGRTSHAERAKVARILATRGLGLGMPARPMVPFVLGGHRGREQENESQDGSENSDEEYDDRGYSIPELHKVASQADHTYLSRESQQPIPRINQASEHVDQISLAPIVSPLPQEFDQNGSLNGKRVLPKPPKPVPVIGMPSPVEKGEIQRTATGGENSLNVERLTSPTKVFGLSLPFSLPALTNTASPLFAGSGFKAASESGSEDSADQDMYDHEEPEREHSLTPPPVKIFERQQPSSPHRIPEFDFESPATKRNRELNIMDEEDPTTEAFKLVEDALPKLNLGRPTSAAGDKTDVKSRLTGLFGERKDVLSASASTPSSSNDSLGPSASTQTPSVNTRVRQRISKDVIRAQLEEKRSMTNLANSRPIMADDDDVFLSPARKTSRESHDNKALPPPPAEAIWLGKLETSARPGLRARQDTMSAEEVLQNVPEPKSALEQLVSDFKFTEFDEYAQASSASPPKTHDSFKLHQAAGVHVVRHATSENLLGNKVRSSQRLAQSSSGLALIEEAPTSDMSIRDSTDVTLGQDLLNAGSRPKRRRSMSTGDASARGTAATSDTADNRMSLLDTFRFEDSSSILTAFEKELNVRNTDRAYKVREHGTVYASADDKVKHNKAGDVDKGRAWRQVRKASDINQYAKEIKAMKAKASNSSKSFGTIFVKVLGVESLSLPMPKEETSFCVTLDNGIDYIRTPYTVFKEGAKVNQEFALVEHANFEFALGVEIRRDAHINKMIQTNANPAPAVPRPAVASRASMVLETGSIQSSSRGLKSLFQSPRKMSKAPKTLVATEAVPEPAASQDNIARYFTDGDSTIGRTHIAFKPIAKNCDARLLEIRYPMFGMHHAAPAPVTGASLPVITTHRGTRHSVQTLPRPAPPPAPVRKQVCKITLQIFRLPPLPGLADDQLPQSIDECLRGMRHHAWHEHEYHQGVMTQKGGDCIVPRRRPFKLIGGNLVASNAVTKKTVFSIDLRKAKLLVNENIDVEVTAGQKKKSIEDELEAGYSKMPRSFTLRFEDDDDFITFWTDTDEEKAGWMKALGSLIGKVPSNPLWAELLAARQRHVKARSASKANLAAVAAGGEEESSTTATTMTGEQIKSPPPPAVPEK